MSSSRARSYCDMLVADNPAVEMCIQLQIRIRTWNRFTQTSLSSPTVFHPGFRGLKALRQYSGSTASSAPAALARRMAASALAKFPAASHSRGWSWRREMRCVDVVMVVMMVSDGSGPRRRVDQCGALFRGALVGSAIGFLAELGRRGGNGGVCYASVVKRTNGSRGERRRTCFSLSPT